MDPITLSRLQFGLTTVYHFLFVPLTLGLSWFVAFLQTRYFQTKDETYRRMTKFWGKLFLINFAIGVVTGIVQEFQFGMNWSEYSRYVGDIFGAPLAVEALLAFFMRRRLGRLEGGHIARMVLRIGAASVPMALLTWWVSVLCAELPLSGLPLELVTVVAPISVAALVFYAACRWLKIRELDEAISAIGGRLLRRKQNR